MDFRWKIGFRCPFSQNLSQMTPSYKFTESAYQVSIHFVEGSAKWATKLAQWSFCTTPRNLHCAWITGQFFKDRGKSDAEWQIIRNGKGTINEVTLRRAWNRRFGHTILRYWESLTVCTTEKDWTWNPSVFLFYFFIFFKSPRDFYKNCYLCCFCIFSVPHVIFCLFSMF